MLHAAKEKLGDQLNVEWKYFSLEQVNNQHGPDWKLWEQPESFPSRARLAWKGAIAAHKQGKEAFDRFNLALLTARHADGKDLTDPETILDAARQADLDLKQFKQDLEQVDLKPVGRDYEEGRENYGVFGTPTFVFEDGHAAYLRLRPLPPKDQLVDVWQQVRSVIDGRPNILEIKRPVPPTK